jgi:hypothetical protein
MCFVWLIKEIVIISLYNVNCWVFITKAGCVYCAVRNESLNNIQNTLVNDQLDAQIFNTFITILYMYMFRTIFCSSSGGQIVLIKHLVPSL